MSGGKDILLAMSGGVDSSAAVIILQKDGWNVTGLTLDMGYNDEGISRAAKSCDKLGIRHIVRDCRDNFEEKVISYFVKEYAAGHTPSPCVICNRMIKFSEMVSEADSLGIEYIATGHYANKAADIATGAPALYTAADLSKDQSYMLCMLTSEQLSRSIFPLSDYTKQQIREIASSYALPGASARDSQDICFSGGDYRTFLSEKGVEFEKGFFIDTRGNVLGRHKGLPAYTPGQRRGLGISSSDPLYVLKKNIADNTVTLAFENELTRSRVYIDSLSWLNDIGVEDGTELSAKLRYAHRAQRCSLHYTENGAVLDFDEPQRAPAPGQIAAIYDGNRVLGGGIITYAE